MSTAIFLGTYMIAYAVNPEKELVFSISVFVGILIMCSIYDLIFLNFLIRNTQKGI